MLGHTAGTQSAHDQHCSDYDSDYIFPFWKKDAETVGSQAGVPRIPGGWSSSALPGKPICPPRGKESEGGGGAWWAGGEKVGLDSLIGHLHHLLDGRVARRQEVLCVLLHLDGLEPLGHCAEGHPLGAAGAGKPDGHPETGVTTCR